MKVDSLEGCWIEALAPNYPIKRENGTGEADLSIKPEIIKRFLLCWEKSGTLYTMSKLEDFKLTMDESLEIAEDFMKAN